METIMNPLPPEQPLKVAILVCPGFVPMDVFGAHTVLGISPNVEIHLVWKTTDELMGVPTWPTRATTSFADCPDVDVLVVGAIPHEVVDDDEVLAFFKAKSASASAVITVCGGAFLAGAAGLLEGRRATTNFQMLDALPDVGAIPIVGGRIVIDGKFVSAGPVTGSFEAAFAVLERLRGIDVAKMAELTIEYDPRPPYGVGTPDLAGPEMTKASIEAYRPLATAIREHAHRAFLRHRTAASA
jgi:transcriptional regulator GlxA family with amidase domain